MLLALVLAAAPVDVEVMSRGELLIEDTRLEITPSTAAPKMLIGLGLGLAALSFSAMGVAIAELGVLARQPTVLRKDGPGPDTFPAAVDGTVSLLAGALTLALMNGAGTSATYAGVAELVAGGAMSVMGLWLLLQRTGEENALERRRARLFEVLQ